MHLVALRSRLASGELHEGVEVAVGDEAISRADLGVGPGDADVVAGGPLDPQHGDTLLTELELAERPTAQPRPGLDVDLQDGVAVGQVEQPGVVLELEVGEAGQQPGEQHREQAIDPSAPRDDQHDETSDDEHDQPRVAGARLLADERDRQRGHGGHETGAADQHQEHDDPPTGRMIDDRFRFRGGESGARECRASLEAGDLRRHAGEGEGDRRDAGGRQ